MPSRGFTILELLIALALLVAMASLVLPVLVSRSAGYAFDEALRQTRSAAMACRADAQRTGECVEFRAVTLADGRTALVGGLLRGGETTGEIEDELAGVGVSELEGEERVRSSERQYVVLPKSTSVRRPEALAILSEAYAELDEGFVPEPMAWEEETAETAAISLGVFLPDGSFVAGEAVELVGTDGRSARLRVHPWTGLASLEERTVEAASEAAWDEPEFDPLLNEDFGGAAEEERGRPASVGGSR